MCLPVTGAMPRRPPCSNRVSPGSTNVLAPCPKTATIPSALRRTERGAHSARDEARSAHIGPRCATARQLQLPDFGESDRSPRPTTTHVKQAPQRVRVPRVSGLAIADAKAILRSAELRPWVVGLKPSRKPKGTVLSQGFDPGKLANDSQLLSHCHRPPRGVRKPVVLHVRGRELHRASAPRLLHLLRLHPELLGRERLT